MALTDEAGRKAEAEARVHIDKRRIPLVRFVYSNPDASPALSQSAIFGHVIGGAASGRSVRLIDDLRNPRQVMVASDGSYRLGGLEAGRYTIEVVGAEEATTRSQIALDGTNQVEIDLVLPVQSHFGLPASVPIVASTDIVNTDVARTYVASIGVGTLSRSVVNAHVPGSAGRSRQSDRWRRQQLEPSSWRE